jgi:hypothetical protein
MWYIGTTIPRHGRGTIRRGLLAMTRSEFTELVVPITARVQGRALDAGLEAGLQREFPVDGPACRAILGACHQAIADGWMCAQGQAGRKFGRVIEPAATTHQLSVDVVELEDIAGPHHRHPNGEICLIMPTTPTATFDGRGAGWLVYAPGTAHRPTVRHGKALVLYMLPDGVIEFTKESPR